MATGHFYRSSDAPGETATPGDAAGDFITFLDDILDIGAPGAFWEKPFTGTNKAAYRATTGERKYLRVDDTNAKCVLLQMFDTMSDVDTGTNQLPAPSRPDICFLKFNSLGATPRKWRAVGDSRGFGVWSNPFVTLTPQYQFNTCGMWFGEITPFDPLDGNLTHLSGVSGNYPFNPSTTNIDDGCFPCGTRNVIGGTVIYQNTLQPFISSADPAGLNPGAPAFMMKPFAGASSGANSSACAYNQGAAFVASPMYVVGTSMTPADTSFQRGVAYMRGRMPYIYDTPYSFGSGLSEPTVITEGADEFEVFLGYGATGINPSSTVANMMLVRTSNNEPGRA